MRKWEKDKQTPKEAALIEPYEYRYLKLFIHNFLIWFIIHISILLH